MSKRTVDKNYIYRKRQSVIIGIVLVVAVLFMCCTAVPLLRQQKEFDEYCELVEEIAAGSQDESEGTNKSQNANAAIPSIHKSKTLYPDMVAWIRIPQSNIDYPVMASDGNYYLNHLPSGKESQNGSIYCYNTQVIMPHNKADKNIVIYGHRISKRTMFGYLDVINDKGYVGNNDKNKIYLQTSEGIFEYELFSSYKISKYENYGRINFASSSDFITYCEMLKSRSSTQNNDVVEFNDNDYLITLVSCTKSSLNKDDRVVVHGKLISFTPT